MGRARASQHVPTNLEESRLPALEPEATDRSSASSTWMEPLGPLRSERNSDMEDVATEDRQSCFSTSSVLQDRDRRSSAQDDCSGSDTSSASCRRASIVSALERAVEADPWSKSRPSWNHLPTDVPLEDASARNFSKRNSLRRSVLGISNHIHPITASNIHPDAQHTENNIASSNKRVCAAGGDRVRSASTSDLPVDISKASIRVASKRPVTSASADARTSSGTAPVSPQEESASPSQIANPANSLSQLDGNSEKVLLGRKRIQERWSTASRNAILGTGTVREKMELQALQQSCHKSGEGEDQQLLLRLILEDPSGGDDFVREFPAWYNLDPTSSLRIRWDVFTTTFLMYLFLVLPLRLGFDMQAKGGLYWLENVVVPCVFGVDIVLNCITGVYITADDEFTVGLGLGNLNRCQYLSYSFRHIISTYVNGWLAIDLMSTFPWEMMEAVGAWGSNSALSVVPRMLKLMRLSRLLRLVRFLKIHKQFTKTIKSYIPNDALQLLQMACTVCMIAHYTSCGWYYVAHSESHEPTWLEVYYQGENHPTVAQLYLTSMYWSFATIASVGYGDVVAVSKGEQIYSILVMYLGIAVVSVMTSRLTTILSEFNARDASISRDLAMVQSYCDYRNLPPKLRATVLDYFELRITQRRLCNEELVLRELSPALKAQVMSVTFRHVIESVPFFKGCGGHFLSAVLCSMEPFLYAPGDIIIQKGQRELAMFMLQKGKAAVANAHGEMVKELHTGDYFGEIALFFGVRRTATVYAVTFCDVFRLSKECFENVQAQYPDAREIIVNQAEEMFNKSALCFVCGEKGHISAQCTKGKDQVEGSTNPNTGTPERQSDDTVRTTMDMHVPTYRQSEPQPNALSTTNGHFQRNVDSTTIDTPEKATFMQNSMDSGDAQ
mmetsp:Transcript_12044/g.22842  ORF Transcript_12044/g.22842 Transcript_12044/m.22842 type:complete len:897 (+) Transcript_12044:3-2693(+)